MGNFDINTGVVTGWGAVSRSPGPDMTGEYIDFVKKTRGGGGDTIGYPKTAETIHIVDTTGGAYAKNVNNDAKSLPSLILYLIDNPLIKTLVYTDSTGASKIIYSTPKSPVKLISYGSEFEIPAKQPPGKDYTVTNQESKEPTKQPPGKDYTVTNQESKEPTKIDDRVAPVQTQQDSGGGGFLSSLCCSSLCLIGCGVIITIALKK